MPRRISCRVARGVSPSPHTLSRGKTLFSSSETCRPRRARWVAVAEPAGPAPTTTTSDSTLSAPPTGVAAVRRPAVGLSPLGVPGIGTPAPTVVIGLSRRKVRASAAGPSGARQLLHELTRSLRRSTDTHQRRAGRGGTFGFRPATRGNGPIYVRSP